MVHEPYVLCGKLVKSMCFCAISSHPPGASRMFNSYASTLLFCFIQSACHNNGVQICFFLPLLKSSQTPSVHVSMIVLTIFSGSGLALAVKVKFYRDANFTSDLQSGEYREFNSSKILQNLASTIHY